MLNLQSALTETIAAALPKSESETSVGVVSIVAVTVLQSGHLLAEYEVVVSSGAGAIRDLLGSASPLGPGNEFQSGAENLGASVVAHLLAGIEQSPPSQGGTAS